MAGKESNKRERRERERHWEGQKRLGRERRESRGTESVCVCFIIIRLSIFPLQSVSSLYDYKPIFLLRDQAGVVKISIGTVGLEGEGVSCQVLLSVCRTERVTAAVSHREYIHYSLLESKWRSFTIDVALDCKTPPLTTLIMSNYSTSTFYICIHCTYLIEFWGHEIQ